MFLSDSLAAVVVDAGKVRLGAYAPSALRH